MKKLTEADHQTLVMCWAKKISLAGRAELDLLFHIPNGGSRSKREGAMFKAMGVKAGVPDLCLPVMANGHGALWVEMKADNGKVGDDQGKWHTDLARHGGKVAVAWNWREAVDAIKDYLGGHWPEVDMETMEGRLNHG